MTSVCFNPNMKQLGKVDVGMIHTHTHLLILGYIPYPHTTCAATGSMDSCLMVWHFKPQTRAYRFVGHKARNPQFSVLPSSPAISHLISPPLSPITISFFPQNLYCFCFPIGCHIVGSFFSVWTSCGFCIAGQDSPTVDTQCVSLNTRGTHTSAAF